MLIRITLSLSFATLLAGCAGTYQIEPLPNDHPANPEAQAAPDRAPSDTLAYDKPIEPPPPATMPGHDMHMEGGGSHDGAMQHDQHQQHE